MKKLIFILSILLYFSTAHAGDFYIAESAAGDESGSSCANAHAITGLTWNGGDIDDGDTLHLCGTIATTLTIGDSGGSGTEYTILFESGAKFSKAYWGLTTSAAIYATGKSYIIIDGSTNGIIEATDNGTSPTYSNQQQFDAIYMTGSSDIEIKDLTVRNMYVRNSEGDFSGGVDGSYGFRFSQAGSNIKIHDNTMTYIPRFILVNFGSNASGWEIYNNTMQHGHTGIIVSDSAAITLTGLLIHDNTINPDDTWHFNDNNERWHGDLIHFWTSSGGRIYQPKIYNNTFGPKVSMKLSISATTAAVFIEDNVDDLLVYNNLFLLDSGNYTTDGLVCLDASSSFTQDNPRVLNNTFVGNDQGYTMFVYYTGSQGVEFKNNIVYDIGNVFYASGATLAAANFTNNVYWSIDDPNTWNGNSYATWTGLGFDVDSSNGSQPSLDANYVPTSDDTIAKDQGLDLSAYFTTDKNGNTRSGSWDIGAYEYGTTVGIQGPSILSGGEIH